jgi:hypothetical protein
MSSTIGSSVFVDSIPLGEIYWLRTVTTEYWLEFRGERKATVYCKNHGADCVRNLGIRLMQARIAEHEGFVMYDLDGRPLIAIVPHEIKRVSSSHIPSM